MILDIQKNSKEILLDYINQENNSDLLLDDFVFDTPQSITVTASGKNTKIKLSAKETSTYYGFREIFYKRLNFSDIFNNEKTPLINKTALKLSELIPNINNLYGINLTEDDYIEADVPLFDYSDPDKTRIVTISSKPDSILFTGSYDFVLNSKIAVPIDDGNISRIFYIHQTGYSSIDYKKTILSITNIGTVNENFSLLSNAITVPTFNVSRMLLKNNGEIVLLGDFTLTYTDSNQISNNVIAKTLLLNDDGSVKSHYIDFLYNQNLEINYIENSLVEFKYVIDPTLNLSANHVYRYSEDGLLDTTYETTGIGYAPVIITLCNDGRLYTVSPIVDKEYRIDRLLPNGELDSTFTTIFVSGIGINNPLTVTQIKPVYNNGLWLLLYPAYGVNINSISCKINGVAIVPEGITAAFAWNPILKFQENGSWNKIFSNLLTNNNDKSIYLTSGSTLKPVDTVLVGDENNITFFTYKSNPVTGFDHKQPITFDYGGKLLPLNGIDYQNQFRWVDCKEVFSQYNNQTIAYGTMILPLTSGGYSEISSCIARYSHNGTSLSLIFRNDNTNNGIKNVIMKETTV